MQYSMLSYTTRDGRIPSSDANFSNIKIIYFVWFKNGHFLLRQYIVCRSLNRQAKTTLCQFKRFNTVCMSHSSQILSELIRQNRHIPISNNRISSEPLTCNRASMHISFQTLICTWLHAKYSWVMFLFKLNTMHTKHNDTSVLHFLLSPSKPLFSSFTTFRLRGKISIRAPFGSSVHFFFLHSMIRAHIARYKYTCFAFTSIISGMWCEFWNWERTSYLFSLFSSIHIYISVVSGFWYDFSFIFFFFFITARTMKIQKLFSVTHKDSINKIHNWILLTRIEKWRYDVHRYFRHGSSYHSIENLFTVLLCKSIAIIYSTF